MPQNHLGQHRFAKQIGPWGSFADIQLVVQSGDTKADRLTYHVPHLATDPRRADWTAGVEFGVRYALEHMPSPDRDVAIRISRLHTNPVDSSTMTVAFATCFAVWNALEYVPERAPSFDEKSKSFIFPR